MIQVSNMIFSKALCNHILQVMILIHKVKILTQNGHELVNYASFI